MVRVLRPTFRISPPGRLGPYVDATRLVQHGLAGGGRRGRRGTPRTGRRSPARPPGIIPAADSSCGTLRAGARKRGCLYLIAGFAPVRSRGNARAASDPLGSRYRSRRRSRGNVRLVRQGVRVHVHHHHPVVVVPGPQRPGLVPPPVLRLFGHPVHPPPAADDLLHVGGRAAQRHVKLGGRLRRNAAILTCRPATCSLPPAETVRRAFLAAWPGGANLSRKSCQVKMNK